MKNILLFTLLLTNSIVFAQHQKITQLLNQQLQKEYTRFYSAEEKASFSVTQPFFIDENKLLHFGFTIKNKKGQQTSVKRQVPLDKIALMDKDLNVYFQTLSKDATEIRTDYYANGKAIQTKTKQTHLFFTEINKEHYPNRFMKRLVKAFKKAGYEVECNFINP